jgi:hypothetical protein
MASFRHGRACPGHPRLSRKLKQKTWMPGIRLRQGFGGFRSQARRSFSEGGHEAGHDEFFFG